MSVRRPIGDGEHDDHIGIVPVGAKRLGAIQHPAIPFAHSGHARAACVRSRRWLGQSPRADKLSCRQLADIFLLLRFVAGEKNMIRAERSVRGHDDAHRSVDAREFLDRRDVLDIAHARAAILRRKDRAQQSELAQFLDRGQRKIARLVPLHDVRLDLALGKFTNALLQLQLLVVQLEIHVPSETCNVKRR